MGSAFSPQELERLNSYIVSVLLEAYRRDEITTNELAQISQTVLNTLRSVETVEQANAALHQLSEQYPLLKKSDLENRKFVEENTRSAALDEVTQLLRSGDLNEAAKRAHQYTENNG